MDSDTLLLADVAELFASATGASVDVVPFAGDFVFERELEIGGSDQSLAEGLGNRLGLRADLQFPVNRAQVHVHGVL